MSDGYGSFRWDHYKGWVFEQGDWLIAHLAHKGAAKHYTQGETVSACGSTGQYSTGPHVHVEGPLDRLRRLYRM